MKLLIQPGESQNVLARQGLFGMGAVFSGLALMLAKGITGWPLLVTGGLLVIMGMISGKENKKAGWITGTVGVAIGLPFLLPFLRPMIHTVLNIGSWGMLGLGGLALTGFLYNLIRRM